MTLGFCSFATARVSCFIENPCSFVEAVPGTKDTFLGYCVNSIEGDGITLYVARSDKTGNPLSSIRLNVETLNRQNLVAVNQDKSYLLTASKYSDFLAGGLLVKTKLAPNGLGFFLSCRNSIYLY